MNKLLTKIVGAALGLSMAIGVGVAVASSSKEAIPVSAAETPGSTTISTVSSTTITSDTNFQIVFAKNSTESAPAANASRVRCYAVSNSTSGTTITVSTKNGVNNKYITGISIAGANVSGKGNLAFTFSGTTTSTSSTRGTYPHAATWASSSQLTSVTATATGASTASQGDISSITVSYVTVTSDKTISAFTTDPDDGDTVNVAGASATSTTSTVLYEITYSDNSKGYDVEISCSQVGFSYEDDNAGEATLTFRNNDDYEVTFSANTNFSSTITFHVTGLSVTKFELVKTDAKLKAGNQLIITKSDGSLVMGTYASGNNVPAESISLDGEDFFFGFSVPEEATIFTLGGSSGAWTLETSGGDYLHDPNTSEKNYLYIDSTEDTWDISVTSQGVATIQNVSSSKYVKNNGSMFAAYSSGQNDVSIYMIPSTDPYIEVEVTDGTTSLGVDETVTLEATLINTTGTVTWSLVDNTPSGSGNVAQISTNGNEVTVTGKKDGTVKVRAAFTDCDNVDTLITVTKALSSIAVTTAPTKTTYTEGESFSTAGMVITATYDDGSTAAINEYTYSPNGALTPSDTTITITFGGKSTTQAITVNAKVVTSIAVKTLPTKKSYHSGDSFESAGLEITVTYEGGSTADITSGFTISPATYTFTDADETAGSKTFTVSYSGKSTTFDVTVVGITGPLTNGRYYIMNSDKTYGLTAAAATSGSPTAYDLSVDNNAMTAFDFRLVADNEYEVTVTIEQVKYYLACTTTAATGSNSSIRVNTTSTTAVWHLDNTDVEAEGAYHFYTVPGSVSRYLSCYNTTDWRGYASLSYGDPEVQFVPEGSYANEIAEAIMSDEAGKTLCNGGSTAPSTTLWNSIAGITKIENELAILRNTTAAAKDEHGDTPTGTTAEKAMARYDEIMVRYNTVSVKTYVDFLGRIDAQNLTLRASASNGIFGINSDTASTTTIIVIISLVGLTAIGGYFFIRKRKER